MTEDEMVGWHHLLNDKIRFGTQQSVLAESHHSGGSGPGFKPQVCHLLAV